MRIARIWTGRGPRYAVVGDGMMTVTDLDGSTPTGDLIARGAFVSPTTLGGPTPIEASRLLAPVERPQKIVAVGLNYLDHASEVGRALPTDPLIFAKFPSAIIGPGQPISWSTAVTHAVDFEAELAVVIGRTARNVTRNQALDHVAFYTCLNDVTARDLQQADGQWVRAKSLDSFCPIGPWLVSADEIPDPSKLRISCTVSGELLQDATVADLIFDVPELIERISAAFTLVPGDVIATGTPPGVGWFRNPKRPLRNGDDVLVRIDGIGELRNHAVESSG